MDSPESRTWWGLSPIAVRSIREKHPTQEEKMSPEAIQSLIELFGVEKGVKILNLFTVPNERPEVSITPRTRSIRSCRRLASVKETVNA